ncbi:uncharacterized protein LOC134236819, partial [Saccostrea cucullata]|uniref:uncharacterized protein LOC134236819 n=1 Tax=Saccostrea cuccullata TaxID=36930 RepID=UPI002ED41915
SILFRRKTSKCEAVVMCPQFCLKVKDGCYICECGDSMNTYMEGAIQQMKHDYDPIYQTGSRYLTGNMGSSHPSNEQKQTSAQSPWMSLGMGTFGANSFGGPMMGAASSIEQKGQYLEPDFKEFYRPAGLALPGRCPELNYACPGQCWKTDGFSGCFRCDCEVQTSTAKSTSSSLQVPITAPPTERISTTSTAAPSTMTKSTSSQGPVTLISKQATASTVPSQKTSSILSTSTEVTSSKSTNQNNGIKINQSQTITSTQSTNQNNAIKINQNQPSEQTGTNSLLTSEGNIQKGTLNNKGQNGNTPEKIGGNVDSKSSLTVLTETNRTGSNPSAKSLMDLTGADLFRILIDGMKKHQSLQEVLYTLAHVGGQDHSEENNGDLHNMDNTEPMIHGSEKGHKVNTSETSLQQAHILSLHPVTGLQNVSSDVKLETTLVPPVSYMSGKSQETENTERGQSIGKNCADVGASCPLECHVIDPVSHCPVCGCSNKTFKATDPDIKCAPLDASCPSDCITLTDALCPVCACTHRQTHKVTTEAITSNVSTETAPTSSQMVCKITEEIRNCESSCLKLDQNFCPKCVCTIESKTEIVSDSQTNTPDKENVCPAVERGCPQRCLKFDKNYCAYCFCDNH